MQSTPTTHGAARHRTLRFRAVGVVLALLATAATLVLTEQPSAAVIWWDAPPTCFYGSQWHQSRSNNSAGYVVGLYTRAGQYEQRRYYGGGYEIRYIWVYAVEVWVHMVGMVPAGRAEKLCGARWVSYTA